MADALCLRRMQRHATLYRWLLKGTSNYEENAGFLAGFFYFSSEAVKRAPSYFCVAAFPTYVGFKSEGVLNVSAARLLAACVSATICQILKGYAFDTLLCAE